MERALPTTITVATGKAADLKKQANRELLKK
jgi:hypothetical protein